MFTKKF